MVRVKHDVLDRSYIGAIGVQRFPAGGKGAERIAGLDVDLPVVVGGLNLEPSFWIMGSQIAREDTCARPPARSSSGLRAQQSPPPGSSGLGRRRWRRLRVHHTPKHGSWLNQAELELSLVSRSCLGRRRIASLAQFRGETRAWNARANRARTRIRWRFTRRDARLKFGYQAKLSKRSKTWWTVTREAVVMRRRGSANFHFTGLGALL